MKKSVRYYFFGLMLSLWNTPFTFSGPSCPASHQTNKRESDGGISILPTEWRSAPHIIMTGEFRGRNLKPDLCRAIQDQNFSMVEKLLLSGAGVDFDTIELARKYPNSSIVKLLAKYLNLNTDLAKSLGIQKFTDYSD